MKLKDKLKGLAIGESILFPKNKEKSIRSYCSIIKSIDESYAFKVENINDLEIKATRVEPIDAESISDKLRGMKAGDKEYFDNDRYDNIHALVAYVRNEKSDYKVKRVVQVEKL